VQADLRFARALWPVLLAAVVAFVVVDFVRHPVLGTVSEAAPEAHLTLWLPQTEVSGETGGTVHELAGSLLLFGRPAAVGVLAGGSSLAVTSFLGSPQGTGQLLAVSSETLADLAQERASALIGDDPLRAARAQRLLERAIPVGVIEQEPMTVAVPASSPTASVRALMSDLRASPDAHLFAITDDSWAADNLAVLVSEAGVDGLVPYRVFPSAQDASLSLAAGSADVILAPHGTLLPDIRAGRLRTLPWPVGRSPLPRTWVELLAAPGTPTQQVSAVRRQLRALVESSAWRGRRGWQGQAPPLGLLSSQRLRGFLAEQIAQAARLEQVVMRVEHR
jgi:hypothetical protein